ncbi:hypothetical protein N510_002385 [Firmicutes bacterium ASF500]|nr:hypothetical protein N510_002385 [Firmicutes bacterium ASF500]
MFNKKSHGEYKLKIAANDCQNVEFSTTGRDKLIDGEKVTYEAKGPGKTASLYEIKTTEDGYLKLEGAVAASVADKIEYSAKVSRDDCPTRTHPTPLAKLPRKLHISIHLMEIRPRA